MFDSAQKSLPSTTSKNGCHGTCETLRNTKRLGPIDSELGADKKKNYRNGFEPPAEGLYKYKAKLRAQLRYMGERPRLGG